MRSVAAVVLTIVSASALHAQESPFQLTARDYFHRVTADYMLNALNVILGVHPGRNTRSFASGVGSESMTTAYGFNRADWSYIPGGVVSGTNLIRPDLPELKNYPFLWQQAEYVMGGGATHYMFLALAADQVLNEKR